MASYPVVFDVDRPANFDRTQIAIRLLIILILAILAGSIGWAFGLLYLAVPVAGAILISQRGAEAYVARREENMARWLRWIAAAYAYIMILTDRLPTQASETTVKFDMTPTGTPSAGQTLLRIILAIPHALVLGILDFIDFFVIIIAAIYVLASQSYPEGLYGFSRGVLRWHARMYAYLSGLVQEYPPFALDTGSEAGGALTMPVDPTST